MCLHQFHLRGWRCFLSFLGLFLGFSNAVVAQYGIVENHFTLKGTVLSADCLSAVPSLKLSIQPPSQDQQISDIIAEGATDAQGNFSLNTYYFLNEESYILRVQDMDGPENGAFHDTAFVVKTEDLKFAGDEQGHWTRMLTNTVPLSIRVHRDGPSPCEAQKDTLVPALTPEPASITDADDTTNFMMADEPELLPYDNTEDTAWAKMASMAEHEGIKITTYPNPNKGLLHIEIEVNADSKALLQLFDDRYRKIIEQERTLQAGINRHLMDISSCTPGTYFLEIQTENFRRIIKIIRLSDEFQR